MGKRVCAGGLPEATEDGRTVQAGRGATDGEIAPDVPSAHSRVASDLRRSYKAVGAQANRTVMWRHRLAAWRIWCLALAVPPSAIAPSGAAPAGTSATSGRAPPATLSSIRLTSSCSSWGAPLAGALADAAEQSG